MDHRGNPADEEGTELEGYRSRGREWEAHLFLTSYPVLLLGEN